MSNRRIKIAIISLVVILIIALLSFKFIFSSDSTSKDSSLADKQKVAVHDADKAKSGITNTVSKLADGIKNVDVDQILDQVKLTKEQKVEVKNKMSEEISKKLPGVSADDLFNSEFVKKLVAEAIEVKNVNVTNVTDVSENEKIANVSINIAVMGKEINKDEKIKFIFDNNRWLIKPEGDYNKFLDSLVVN